MSDMSSVIVKIKAALDEAQTAAGVPLLTAQVATLTSANAGLTTANAALTLKITKAKADLA